MGARKSRKNSDDRLPLRWGVILAIAIGAGLGAGVVGGPIAGIGVGIAQGYIGSAGLGTITERPEMFGQVLVFLVIPETIIIFGFVIAFFLYGKMG